MLFFCLYVPYTLGMEKTSAQEAYYSHLEKTALNTRALSRLGRIKFNRATRGVQRVGAQMGRGFQRWGRGIQRATGRTPAPQAAAYNPLQRSTMPTQKRLNMPQKPQGMLGRARDVYEKAQVGLGQQMAKGTLDLNAQDMWLPLMGMR